MPALMPFDFKKYFELGFESFTNLPYVEPTKAGMQKIAAYYKNKYKANIDLIFSEPEQRLAFDLTLKDDSFEKHIAGTIQKDVKNNFDPNRKSFQKLYLFETVGESHGTPVLLLQKGNLIKIVVADAYIGKEFNLKAATYIKNALSGLGYKVTVGGIYDSWQNDNYSCHFFGLIYGRELSTSPQLFDELIASRQSTRYPDAVAYAFPHSFLMTGQSRKYFSHLKDQDLTYHKLNYKQFKTRFMNDGVNQYPRLKSLKMAMRLEIEHYVEQLKQQLGAAFTEKMQLFFKVHARREYERLAMKDQYKDGIPSLNSFAVKFLIYCKDKLNPDLQNFLEKYYEPTSTLLSFGTSVVYPADAFFELSAPLTRREAVDYFKRLNKDGLSENELLQLRTVIQLELKKSVPLKSPNLPLIEDLKEQVGEKYLFDFIKKHCSPVDLERYTQYKGHVSSPKPR